MVAWTGKRNFATAYIKGKYLECSFDLLEHVGHEHLKAAFPTTKSVLTYRFMLEPDEDIDAQLIIGLNKLTKLPATEHADKRFYTENLAGSAAHRTNWRSHNRISSLYGCHYT